MLYTVDAIFRNRAGKEISRAYPLWKGEVDGERAALEAAHEALTARLPFPEGTDVIALTIKGADGSSASCSEYAEDFEIGYGASCVGSTGLLGDGIDVDLTDEQREAAERLMQDRAIDALPDDLKRKLVEQQHEDAVDSFFDGFDGDAPRRSTTTTVGGESDDDGFRETIKRVADRQDAHTCDKTFETCRDRFNNEQNFGGLGRGKCPYIFGGSSCGVSPRTGQAVPGSAQPGRNTGSVAGGGSRPGVHDAPGAANAKAGSRSGRQGAGRDGLAGNQHAPGRRDPGGVWSHQVVNQDPVRAIDEAARQIEAHTGLRPNRVRLTRAQYNRLVEECRKSGLAPHTVQDVQQIHGLDIEVVDNDPHMPSIQVEQPSRRTKGLSWFMDEASLTDAQRKLIFEMMRDQGPKGIISGIGRGRGFYGRPAWLTPPEVVFPRSEEYKRRVLGVFPDDDAKEAT